MFHPPLAPWTGIALFVWVLALCGEMLLRLIVPILIPLQTGKEGVAPIRLLLREALFAAGNPIGSMLRSLESRLGVSLRSTWAIAFIEGAALPLLALLGLLLWGGTSVAIVEMDQLGVREHFGRIAGEPLTPGLHFKLPWPCGRIRTFSVKTVHQVPIGYVEEEQPKNLKQPRALLWTRGHAKEEFALVLGGGTELVVVNALLYYKIAEDANGFLDYVYRSSRAGRGPDRVRLPSLDGGDAWANTRRGAFGRPRPSLPAAWRVPSGGSRARPDSGWKSSISL